MDVVVCPACRAGLEAGSDAWRCRGCATKFGALRGVPDLRTSDDVFLPNLEDWRLARRLEADYDRLDFRGLLERYYDLRPEIPPDRRRREVTHILTASGRASQWIATLGLEGDGPLLDLGCGPGGFLAEAAARLGGRPLWGLDIAMRWLLLARKRLDEAGLGRVRLVCAGAEAMPFADAAFAGIAAGDAIEHVADQAATIREAHRVLRPGGRLVMATPNRFSLAPEPHVGVWGVGFLPRSWMGPYVRLARGLDFRAIHTRGAGGWRRLIRSGPFGGGTIGAPTLPEEELAHFGGLKARLGRTYNRLVATRPGQALARRVGPLLHIVCTKADGPSRRRVTRTP